MCLCSQFVVLLDSFITPWLCSSVSCQIVTLCVFKPLYFTVRSCPLLDVMLASSVLCLFFGSCSLSLDYCLINTAFGSYSPLSLSSSAQQVYTLISPLQPRYFWKFVENRFNQIIKMNQQFKRTISSQIRCHCFTQMPKRKWKLLSRFIKKDTSSTFIA